MNILLDSCTLLWSALEVKKGIFAVGDVRSGSVKRVASAVGEGFVVVSVLHQYLASVE